MNIIEAIKSGKKYRQKGDRGYYLPPHECFSYTFTIEQILADDWQVKDPVVIKKSGFLCVIKTKNGKEKFMYAANDELLKFFKNRYNVSRVKRKIR